MRCRALTSDKNQRRDYFEKWDGRTLRPRGQHSRFRYWSMPYGRKPITADPAPDRLTAHQMYADYRNAPALDDIETFVASEFPPIGTYVAHGDIDGYTLTLHNAS